MIVAIGAVVLAKTRWGYETLATGGNELAAIYAGIPTRWVRVRSYLLSSLCATVAGLMAVAQDKGASPQGGLSAELIVIAAVIIGGASILGGRGRVLGSFLGALLTVLINKVLREGVPITRTLMINGEPTEVQAHFSLPAGAVPAFIGMLLLVAVLIEPLVIRQRLPARIWAWLMRRAPPKLLESGGIAIEGAQTKGAMAADIALSARGFGKFLARRDALAIMLTALLWLVGLYLRPDYWALLPNTFAILLNYTELALIAVGLTYVIAAGDIDLSVGAVLALAGSTAAYSLKVLGLGPGRSDRHRSRCRARCRRVQRHYDRGFPPAGIHRHARHVLYRPRTCLVARRGTAAHRLHRALQSDRPQGRRHPLLFRPCRGRRVFSARSPTWSACRRCG